MVSNIFYFHPYLGRLEDSLRAIGKPRVALVVTRTTFCGRPLRRNLVASEETFQEGKCLQGSGLAIMYIRIPGLNYQRNEKEVCKLWWEDATAFTDVMYGKRYLPQEWCLQSYSPMDMQYKLINIVSMPPSYSTQIMILFAFDWPFISWRQFWQWKLELWLSCYKFTTWKAESLGWSLALVGHLLS